MKENEKRDQQDSHLNTPSEANREKHIHFIVVEEENSRQIVGNRNTDKERQEEWNQGIEEGRKENQNSGEDRSAVPPDNDETIGNP